MNTILTVGRTAAVNDASMHAHKNYRTMLCTSGGGKIQFEDAVQDYAKGDLIIIEPNVPHCNAAFMECSDIYLTLDNLPFAVDKIHVAHDTATGVLAQCLHQIHYFYHSEVSGRDGILCSFGELLTNLIVALSPVESVSPVMQRLKIATMKHFPESSFSIMRCWNRRKTTTPII